VDDYVALAWESRVNRIRRGVRRRVMDRNAIAVCRERVSDGRTNPS
jgi:hypothetical protein